MKKPKPLPAETVMRYAVHPAAAQAIKYIDGMHDHWIALPQVGQVITLAFLVDPQSLLPMPVRVLEIRELLDLQPPTIAIVVGPAH